MTDLDLFFQFLKGRYHSNQFYVKKLQNDLYLQAGVPKRIGIWQFRFKNIQWQHCIYIVCNFNQNWFSNPRDYEGDTCTFLDETAKIDISPESRQVSDRSSSAFQRW